MTRKTLARRIFETSNLRGTFRLRSGQVSDEYFDKYLFESDPRLLLAIARAMTGLLPPGAQLIAGLEMGGIPLATILSQVAGLPAVFVRKSRKAYGTCKLAEGGDVSGKSLVVVEDVVTSGGQVVESAQSLRGFGAHVTDVVCVIDRGAGGRALLSDHGLDLRPLFTMAELREAVVAKPRLA